MYSVHIGLLLRTGQTPCELTHGFAQDQFPAEPVQGPESKKLGDAVMLAAGFRGAATMPANRIAFAGAAQYGSAPLPTMTMTSAPTFQDCDTMNDRDMFAIVRGPSSLAIESDVVRTAISS